MVAKTEGRSTRTALKLTPSKTLSRVTLRTAKLEPAKAPTSTPSPTTVRSKTKASAYGQAFLQTKSSLRTRRVLTPIPSFNTPKTRKGTSNDGANEGNESLEDKIRSALTTPQTTHHVDAPASIKSVRWDPAIVSCGPITPPAPISTSLSSHNKTEPTRGPEPASSNPKHSGSSKEVIMQSLSRLKKADRDTLQSLLNELKSAESEDKPHCSSGTLHRERQVGSGSNVTLLNPEAPAFRKYATQRAQIAQRKAYANLGKATLTIPRKRPHLLGGEGTRRDLQEPTWINIFNPPQAMPHGTPATPSAPSSLEAASGCLQQNLARPFELPSGPWAPNPFPAYGHGQISTLNVTPQIPWTPPTEPHYPMWGPVSPPPGFQNLPQFGYWVNPSGFPVPLPPHSIQPIQPIHSVEPSMIRVPRRPIRPRGGKGPMVDVGPEFIPPEDGPGREASAIEAGWATSLLSKFREKYPQTGRVKAENLAPTTMRHAAAIQQRLEFILYQENERHAREGSSGDEMLEKITVATKHPRPRGDHSSEEKPPSYKRYDTATGIKFEFSEDERVTSSQDASTDEIVRDQKEALAHLREKSASVEETTAGEESVGHASPGEDQIEESQAEDQAPAAVHELSRSFSNLSLASDCSCSGCSL